MNSLYLENSIFFYGNTANAMPVDLAGHSPAGLADVPIPSVSSPEFLVSGDTSLLEQLLSGPSE